MGRGTRKKKSRTKHSSPGQLELPLDEVERRLDDLRRHAALLQRVDLPGPLREFLIAIYTLGPVDRGKTRGAQEIYRVTWSEVARELDCAPTDSTCRQFRRLKRRAVDAGLLVEEPDHDRTGRRIGNKLRFDWPRIARLSRRPADLTAPARDGPVNAFQADGGADNAVSAPPDKGMSGAPDIAPMDHGYHGTHGFMDHGNHGDGAPALEPPPPGATRDSPSRSKAADGVYEFAFDEATKRNRVRAPTDQAETGTAERANPSSGGWPIRVNAHSLANPRAVERLYRHAAAQGWIADCEANRVNLFACAVHARKHANDARGAGPLFTWLVKRKIWERDDRLGASDDEARQMLRALRRRIDAAHAAAGDTYRPATGGRQCGSTAWSAQAEIEKLALRFGRGTDH